MSEKRTIECRGTVIPYTLKRRRGMRRVNLTFYADGDLLVTAPRTYPLFFIEQALVRARDWIAPRLKKAQKNVTIEKSVVQLLKKSACTLIRARLEQLNVHYGFSYKRISVRFQKSVWGSCSEAGTLSFNVKLLCLPEKLRDYVIVHELCHLAQLNHSPYFWQLVARTVPDYRARRKELRKVAA